MLLWGGMQVHETAMKQRYSSMAGAAMRLYKLTLSPAFALFGVQCRHAPTCSEYMAEAVTRHGFWAGGWMGLARFTRCRPGGTCGVDEVPEFPNANATIFTPWRYGLWSKQQLVTSDREDPGSDQ